MAKVKSKKTNGLSAWLPDTPMKDLLEYSYCPIHGLEENNFFGINGPCRYTCTGSINIGKIKELSSLEKLLYGIEDAELK